MKKNPQRNNNANLPTLSLPSIHEVKTFVLEWNINFPIDRWWRKKHNVAFNSPMHREVSFLDMRFEWEEDKLYDKLYEPENDYKINSGNYMKKEKESDMPEDLKRETFKKEFLETDLSQFDSL